MGIFGQSQAGQARYSGELHNLQLTQSVFGTTAPIIFGTRRVAAKLLFYGGFYAVTAPNSGGGKGLGGGKGDTAYDYYADVQLALASGSASGGCLGLLNVWDQQGKLQNESGSYTYTVPPGGGTVTPMSAAGSPPIQQDLGVSKAATYSVVANDYGSGGSRTLTGTQSVPLTKVTGTPAAGQYSFNASTSSYTFAAADAGAVVTICYSAVFSLYYFEQTQAAEIPLSGPYQVSTNVQQYFWSDGGVVRVDTGAPLNQGSDYTESSGVYTFASNLAGVYVYITYTYTSSDSSVTNTSTLNLTFFGGTLGQTPASYMQSKYPGSDFGYTGICYLLANPMALGESAVLPSYNYEVVGLNIFPGGGLDAHPCDAFRTLLYDAFLGVGFPSANVDAWTSAYAYWAANGYLLSSSLDTQTSVSEALSNIIETGNVGAVWSGGLLKLIPYGDATCVGNGYTYTPNTTPVAVFTWNNLLSPSETKAGSSTSDDVLQVAQKAPQDCLNYVQAQWCNRANDYNNELINEQNDAFVNDYGRRIESPQTWDWITTAAAATWALNLRLKRQCYIRNTYKFWLPFWFSYIEPMDIVTLPTGENVRITQIEDDPDGRLSVEAEQWTYGSGNVTIYPKQAPSSFQPNLSSSAPGDAVPVVIQNTITQNSVPYLVQIAAASSNPAWGGANVYLSLDGVTYTQIGTVVAPSALGLLTTNLPSSPDPDLTDTLGVDISLSSGAELVSVTQFLADKLATLCAIVDQGGESSELIAYENAALTGAGRYNLTYLRRGAYGTAALAHTIGAYFAFLGPQYQFATYQSNTQLMGHLFYLKLQSFNLAGKMTQELSTCQEHPFVFGYNAGQKGDIYFPSTAVVSTSGNGTVTNQNNAFSGIFTNFATLDGGAANTNGVAECGYEGFPSLTLNYPATLYISYQNLRGFATLPGLYVGGIAAISVSNNGVPLVPNWFVAYTEQPYFQVPSAPSGTVALSLPAGTNLGGLQVQCSACNYTPFAGNSVAGHLEVIQVWIQ
jgi:hypothetical protein